VTYSVTTVFEDAENGIRVRTGLMPGDIGLITYLHGVVYDEEYGLDTTFEAYVAKPLAEFALSQGNPRQRMWIVEKDGVVCGCAAVVEHSREEAQFRWLLLSSDARGVGLGRRLVEWALKFCRDQGFRSVFLWTFSELEAAAHLYRTHGFKLTEEKTHMIWGREITEQRYDLCVS
jgi:N-acetylglutamate synthase-like GNAT family acetyltransferase